jgi:hypothetical protein
MEKLAAVLIIPSSWGSQLDGEKLLTPRRITQLSCPKRFSIYLFQPSHLRGVIHVGGVDVGDHRGPWGCRNAEEQMTKDKNDNSRQERGSPMEV